VFSHTDSAKISAEKVHFTLTNWKHFRKLRGHLAQKRTAFQQIAEIMSKLLYLPNAR